MILSTATSTKKKKKNRRNSALGTGISNRSRLAKRSLARDLSWTRWGGGGRNARFHFTRRDPRGMSVGFIIIIIISVIVCIIVAV